MASMERPRVAGLAAMATLAILISGFLAGALADRSTPGPARYRTVTATVAHTITTTVVLRPPPHRQHRAAPRADHHRNRRRDGRRRRRER
jgi:hypothetical protein